MSWCWFIIVWQVGVCFVLGLYWCWMVWVLVMFCASLVNICPVLLSVGKHLALVLGHSTAMKPVMKPSWFYHTFFLFSFSPVCKSCPLLSSCLFDFLHSPLFCQCWPDELLIRCTLVRVFLLPVSLWYFVKHVRNSQKTLCTECTCISKENVSVNKKEYFALESLDLKEDLVITQNPLWISSLPFKVSVTILMWLMWKTIAMCYLHVCLCEMVRILTAKTKKKD